MNPSQFRHVVSVSRLVATTGTDGKETQTPTVVAASLRCLLEPISASARATVFGNIPQAKLQITWGVEDVRDGDAVTYGARRYRLSGSIPDTLRPTGGYHTAVLEEVAGQ